MKEIRCRRCGAAFPAHHDGAVCPYCGAEAVSKLGNILSFFAMHWIVFALVAIFLIIERPSATSWAVIGLFVALVLAGFMVFGLGRIGGKQRPKEPPRLGLASDDSSVHLQARLTPLRPPKVPEKWRALMQSRPPRDVYLPAKTWTNFLVEGITLLSTLYIYASKAHKHRLTLIGFISTFVDPANIGLVLIYVATWVVRLKKLLTTREILRDGLVTMAYTTDRSWNRAAYQFWTETGQIFERRTSVVQRKEFRAGGFSIVPVFYMAADPRKSVALYGTEFLIRLPADSPVQQLKKAPANA